MINCGTEKQKKQAKIEVKMLEEYIHNHVNTMAFELANVRFGFDQEEVEMIEKALL